MISTGFELMLLKLDKNAFYRKNMNTRIIQRILYSIMSTSFLLDILCRFSDSFFFLLTTILSKFYAFLPTKMIQIFAILVENV